MKKYRLDEALLALGAVESLEEARKLIMAGRVIVSDQRVDRADFTLSDLKKIRLKKHRIFVSRAGEKLAAFLREVGLEVEVRGQVCLDVGSSTGGFVDCFLRLGAQQVYAVDVGHNQLAWRLRCDPRVTVCEGVDIRSFVAPQGVDFGWITADISFNSLQRLLSTIVRHDVAKTAKILVLIKPQFELPRKLIPEGGVVRCDRHRQLAVQQVEAAFEALGYQVLQSLPSRVPGKSGNREFFCLACSKSSL